jgi:3-oxoadipate enol-lactonase
MRVPTALGELYVDVFGEGSPVVFWHSFLHHGGMWKPQAEALRSRHRVIVIDAPGHGRSSAVRRSFDMADCARAALVVMDACKVERAAMAGLSWGGMVAMQLATMRPERLTGIAVFDTSCRKEPLKNRLEYKALAAVLRTLGPMPMLLDRIEPLFFTEHSRKHRRDIVDPFRAYVSRMDRESIIHGLECITGRPDLTSALGRVRMPALVGVGAEDVAQPLVESEHIARAIAGAQLAVVPSSAHLSALENPDAVTSLLRAFFEKL